MERGAWWATVHGVAQSQHDWNDWAPMQGQRRYNHLENHLISPRKAENAHALQPRSKLTSEAWTPEKLLHVHNRRHKTFTGTALSEIVINWQQPELPHIRLVYCSANVHFLAQSLSCLPDIGVFAWFAFTDEMRRRDSVPSKSTACFCSASLRSYNFCQRKNVPEEWDDRNRCGSKPVAWLLTQLRQSELSQSSH